jgi:serine/threonine protein kinase/Flp pilus assembly protein TadD
MNQASAPECLSVESLMAVAADEFLERLDRGGQPDIEEYAGRYPQIATFIRQMFPTLQLMRAPGPDLSATDETAEQGRLSGCLGDFRIRREIGRGGMGVVYEAEQISLGRCVALKVLPFAAALDTKQLQRFKNEAHAAAQLHHTNIVPVISVGCERGVHYYAMQYIDGRPLSQVIHELRCSAGNDEARLPKQPSGPDGLKGDETPIGFRHSSLDILSSLGIRHSSFFRTVAQLGVQAAEALEHAHEEGVVHRDVKPANLLVDAKGKLWITDFGLARCRDNTGLTMSGDLVGTLRYMSPEQALAKRALIDHRTDLYSLGVALYELLTLAPPFDGGDRQELLRQIAFEEPRPPRRRNKPIPAELETVVLKAMEKNSAERYATAQELADDLRRFLDDKPIRARRPTLAQRAAKWCRRHKSVVWAAVLLLVVALIGSGVATLLIARERDAANANYRLAQEDLDTAYQVLDYYVTIAEQRLPREKELNAGDRQLLEKALVVHGRIAHRHSRDPQARLKMAQAYRRIGGIYERLGQAVQAAAAYQQALAVSVQLNSDFPNHPAYRQNLARSYASLGGVIKNYLFDGRRAELEQAYAKALRIQKQLVQEDPANLEYQHDLGWTYFLLGMMHLLDGPLTEAEAPVRQAVEIRERLVVARPTEFKYRQELGMSLGNLGNVFTRTGRYENAQPVVRRELEVRQQLVDDFPADPEARSFLADAYMDLAELLGLTDQFQEAAALLRQAVSLRRNLATEFPSFFEYQGGLAWSSTKLGDALRRMGAQDEATAAYQEALAAFAKAIHLQPNNAQVDVHRGAVFACLGAEDEALADWEQALQHGVDKPEAINGMAWRLAVCLPLRVHNPERAIQLAQKAVALAPQKAAVWIALGATCYRAGQWDQAVAALEKSVQFGPGGHCVPWFFLAMTQWQRGELMKAREAYDRGVQWMDQHKPYDEDHCRLRAEAAALLGI